MKTAATMSFVAVLSLFAAPALASDFKCSDVGEKEIVDHDPVFEKDHIRCLAEPGFQCTTFSTGVSVNYIPEKNMTRISCYAKPENHTSRSIVFMSGRCNIAASGKGEYHRVSTKERIAPGGYARLCWGKGDNKECTVTCE